VENFNTKEILAILAKNKTRILIVTVAAALASVVISYLLKPKFKSFAVVYPVNISPSSEESNTEQLLQFFNSEEVMNAVAREHDLYNHYEIDTASHGARALFKLYFNSNVKISPTLYESIEIEVRDTDPKKAQQVAQGMIDATNQLIFEIKRERLAEYIANTSNAISSEMHAIDSINKRILEMREKYGIVDVKAQAKYLSKKMIGGKEALKGADQLLYEGLKSKSTEIETQWNLMNGQLQTGIGFINQKDKYLFDYNSRISFTNVVSKPTLPDKKYFPVRWLIVSVSTLSVLALACLFFILTNKSVRKID
jgi:uncharacterized protein involved in exopolysaccharide biosynthesis